MNAESSRLVIVERNHVTLEIVNLHEARGVNTFPSWSSAVITPVETLLEKHTVI